MAIKETIIVKNWKELSEVFEKRDFHFNKCNVVAIGSKNNKLNHFEIEVK